MKDFILFSFRYIKKQLRDIHEDTNIFKDNLNISDNNNINQSPIIDNDKAFLLNDKLLVMNNILNDSDTLIFELKTLIYNLKETDNIYQLGLELLTPLSKELAKILQLLQTEIIVETTRSPSPSRDCIYSNRSNKSNFSTVEKSINEINKNDSFTNKSFFISLEKPVLLSNHLYLEALQKKIEEVKELKHALLEIAKASVNDEVFYFLLYLNCIYN